MTPQRNCLSLAFASDSAVTLSWSIYSLPLYLGQLFPSMNAHYNDLGCFLNDCALVHMNSSRHFKHTGIRISGHKKQKQKQKPHRPLSFVFKMKFV